MKKTKVKISSIPNAQGAEATEVQYKYYGGVDRREDIDIFKFYQDLLIANPEHCYGYPNNFSTPTVHDRQ